MVSLFLVPFVVILILTGVILLIIGLVVNQKWLSRTLLGAGWIIMGTPLILIALSFLLASLNHKDYVGEYSGTTDKGRVVMLELNYNKNFVMKMDECDSVVTGAWDNVMYDDYVLELYLLENEYVIQATLSRSALSFYNSLSLGCLTNEKLALKKVVNND